MCIPTFDEPVQQEREEYTEDECGYPKSYEYTDEGGGIEDYARSGRGCKNCADQDSDYDDNNYYYREYLKKRNYYPSCGHMLVTLQTRSQVSLDIFKGYAQIKCTG